MLVDYSDDEDDDERGNRDEGKKTDGGAAAAVTEKQKETPPPQAQQTKQESKQTAAQQEEDTEWVLPPRPRDEDSTSPAYRRAEQLLGVQASTGRHLGAEIARSASFGDPCLFEKLLGHSWPEVSQHATLLNDAPDPEVLSRLSML